MDAIATCSCISCPAVPDPRAAGDRARARATGRRAYGCVTRPIGINSVARVLQLQVDLQNYAHAGVQDVQRRSMLMRSTRSTQVRMHSQIK